MKRDDQRGASAVEYGLLIAVCVLVFLVAVISLQKVVKSVFNQSACDSSRGYSCTSS